MEWKAKWIKPNNDMGDVAPAFTKSFSIKREVREAKLYITAMGTYEATLNEKRIGDFILAPGWTTYYQRLQYQVYDVTNMLNKHNSLGVIVGKGWYRSPMPGSWGKSVFQDNLMKNPAGMIAQLEIQYMNGESEIVISDESWHVSESSVRFSELYDGEIYDASFVPKGNDVVTVFDGPYHTLIPQEGEKVVEQERIRVMDIFTTPEGDVIIDFGQEVSGYIEIDVDAKEGEVVDLSFAEVLDKDGNFYTENYRDAKAIYRYICCNGRQIHKPKLTFWGFRYARVNEFPGGLKQINPQSFTAIALHSQIEQIGQICCSEPLLNKLFSNVLWGQKDNFVDVPTDCPQRDERLGWTGDAQVFVRAACLNYDVEKFFKKWLADLAADQWDSGYVPHVVPDILQHPKASAAWGDAATICPWEVYRAYGNPKILIDQFECMCKWIEYITAETTTQYLWTGGKHYGDWLGLDAPSGSYTGSSRKDFIASAFYARSVELVIKSGKAIDKDVKKYEELYKNILNTFQKTYTEYETQTECVLAIHFRLAFDCQGVADKLAKMIREAGTQLKTGFVGTPYLLHALSDYGYSELAYSLLLRKEYPSWLYPVTKGATTIWEHWDGIMEDGSFWSSNMNSFNHYAYGAVADWMYCVAGGINPKEPGYAKTLIAPVPDKRLDWFKASLHTRYGLIRSQWRKEENNWRYEITTPVEGKIIIGSNEYIVQPGTYYYYNKIQ